MLSAGLDPVSEYCPDLASKPISDQDAPIISLVRVAVRIKSVSASAASPRCAPS